MSNSKSINSSNKYNKTDLLPGKGISLYINDFRNE